MNREEIIEASRMSDCEMDCGYCMSNCTNRADAPDGICSSKMVKCPFELGAEWMQKESNLRDIRLDTIQCCEEYLAKFGTLDGVYEHYFADITEK